MNSKMNRSHLKTSQILLCLLAVLLLTSPLEAQETDRNAGTAGLGALIGLALGEDISSIGWAAGIGAASAVIAVDAVDNYYYSSTDQNQTRPRPKASATYRKVGPSQTTSGLENITALQSAMGTENYLGYQALKTCEFERAYALATAGTLSRDSDHRLVGFWLEAMISVEEQNQGRSSHVFKQLVELDPDIDSIQQAAIKTDKAVLELRAERKQLGLPICDR